MLTELPDYPWDAMAPFVAKAKAHPGGALDLSIGSPVDPTPEVVRDALAQARAHVAAGPVALGVQP